MSGYRTLAVVLAVLGIAFAGYVEYGTPRAPDFEPSFGVFAYNAGPYVLAAILAVLSPYGRALCVASVAMLALEAYAYYVVFVLQPTAESALIYLYKPFIDLAIIATAMLAGFLLTRGRDQRA